MSKRRFFNFPGDVGKTVRFRQRNLCAQCGDSLVVHDIEYAHHVVPNQCGNPADPAHQWIASDENCVLLCGGCHSRVHEDGKTKLGAVAAPSFFVHSHGYDKDLHRWWAAKLDIKAMQIWRYIEAKHNGTGMGA